MWFKRMNKRNLISTVIGVLVLTLISVFSTKSFELPKILNLIFIYSIAALALNIVCGCLGEFVLGHGGFLLIGYTVFVLISTLLKNHIDPAFFKQNIYTIKKSSKRHYFPKKHL